ncbi:unnamed protein product [Soboliphyme baturini]|uniref:ASCH domain-containing protein n=1 Tax=Soboliphyme baturini TaxID=241478 RepID=A0A183IYZ1_9BILA|nr:unnamed protein product [Soboliphyme baturini]
MAEVMNSTYRPSKGLEAAVTQKNKLLEYQENRITRTSVYDDQEKENYNICMEEPDMLDENFAQPSPYVEKADWLNHYCPEYIDANEMNELEVDADVELIDGSSTKCRVQSEDICRIQNSGKCLSVHQPHEGRTWYSAHRGTLWIASTARRARTEEIREIEDFYKRLYEGTELSLPTEYPSQCLLGYVEVVDCLAQEQYQELYPSGECDAPYVFVCRNAQQLPCNIPIVGKNKIYQLDPTIFHAAKNALGYVVKMNASRTNNGE